MSDVRFEWSRDEIERVDVGTTVVWHTPGAGVLLGLAREKPYVLRTADESDFVRDADGEVLWWVTAKLVSDGRCMEVPLGRCDPKAIRRGQC